MSRPAVLILILVEDGRRLPTKEAAQAFIAGVLILILVEDSRRLNEILRKKIEQAGLNPYSSGR